MDTKDRKKKAEKTEPSARKDPRLADELKTPVKEEEIDSADSAV